MLENKFIKSAIAVFGVVFLGALGSGLWQVAGQPLFDSLSGLLVKAINTVFISYKDSIYVLASKGFIEHASVSLYVFVYTATPILWLWWYLNHKNKRKQELANSKLPENLSLEELENEKDELEAKIFKLTKQAKKLEYLFIFLLAFYAVMMFNSAITMKVVNSVVTYVQVSLDRIRPYESQETIYKLQAEFREIESAEDYYQFYEKLEAILKSHGLSSKSSKPI